MPGAAPKVGASLLPWDACAFLKCRHIGSAVGKHGHCMGAAALGGAAGKIGVAARL